MTAAPAHDVWLELGTSTVYEASGLPCALDPELRPVWPGAAVSGPAFPVECVPGDNLALHLAVETAPAGSVLVVAAGGRLIGYWGEVLTWAARVQGIAGLVIDGAVRDITALERLGFPVFARGVSMLGSGKEAVVSVGEPIRLGGVAVGPGDLVVADRDGVLCLPAGESARVLAAATARTDKERAIIERLRDGERTLDVYGWRELADASGRLDLGA